MTQQIRRHGGPVRAERLRRTRRPGLAMAALALLALGLASACTVRLELASPRPVVGDLSASSAGLTGHERWFAWTPGPPEAPAEEGIVIVSIPPPGRAAPPAASDPVAEAPAVALPPLPSGDRERGELVGRALPLPPPPKPILLAANPPARDAAAGRSRRIQPARPELAVSPVPAPPTGRPDGPHAGRLFGPQTPFSPGPPARSRWSFDPAPAAPALSLAPGVELADPERRYDLAWLAATRAGSIMPGAGPASPGARVPVDLEPGPAPWPPGREPGTPIRLFPFSRPA